MPIARTNLDSQVKEHRVALLTGGTGFTGSNLIRRLISDGWSVHAIVRPTSDLASLAGYLKDIVLHVHNGSTTSMIEIANSAKPDVTFHLAALSLAEHDAGNLETLIHNNILFSTQLVEAVSQSGPANIVNTGTFWQHYENKDYSPTCLYAATKQAFEAILQYYVDVRSCRAITLTLFDSYGPRDIRAKLFSLLQKAGASKEPFPMSPGEQFIDLVHIDDVVEAFVLAGERLLACNANSHERYAVSSGVLINLQEIVRLYEKMAGVKLPINWGGRQYREKEIMRPWDRGEPLPGWLPKVTLADGIRSIINA